MKISFLVSIFILLFTVTIVEAQTVSRTEYNQSDFSISISDITYYKDIKKTQFFVNIEDSKNLQDVAYWKVGAICDNKMSLQLTSSSTDICGKSVRLSSISNNPFYFLFKNKTTESKDFTIKVKAFNNKGKGIHSESLGFGWK